MRVIGVCRFSYPAHGGFRRMHDSLEEREAYLYDDARMALRFWHFESLTLPSLKAQTNPEFTVLVIIGENMPKHWLDRLHEITAPLPQLKIVPTPPIKHRTALELAIKAELGDTDQPSLQFRIDDDDAIGIDFVQQARFALRRSGRFHRETGRMAFDFNSGFSVKLSDTGLAVRAEFGHFLSCGLAVYFPAKDTKTVMNFGHHKLHQVMPMMIQPAPPMYLRSKHDDNDSGDKFQPRNLVPADEAQKELFKTRFNVSEDHIAKVFDDLSALRGKS